ncbi:MAG: hypothetical protein ABJC09_04130 [Terriglobia bacterium]
MISCPNCGSRFLRDSQSRDAEEKRLKWRLKATYRCEDCKVRFIAPTIVFSDLKFARCPKCDRMDLNGWTGKTYTPHFFWTGFKLMFGATRFRCEYCRLNFASFRRRKETFTFKRWENIGAEKRRKENARGEL